MSNDLIMPVSFQPKKGVTVRTHWLITQRLPEIHLAQSERWEGIPHREYSSYNHGRPMRLIYRAAMLRLDWRPGDPLLHDMRDLAGYEGAPSLVYRNINLGVLYATLEANMYGPGKDRCLLDNEYRGDSTMPKGCRDFIHAALDPELSAFVVRFAAPLLDNAARQVLADMATAVDMAEARLREARAEIPKIVDEYRREGFLAIAPCKHLIPNG